MKKEGCLIISLDFELYWGLTGHDDKYLQDHKASVEGALNALKRILQLFKKYNIKCTIAYVGAMNNSNYNEYLKHSPELKPKYLNPNFSSYNLVEKHSWLKENQHLLFVPEFIKSLSNNILVELASHTYSHYYCLEDGQEQEQFNKDINLTAGNNFKTIIFPRNQVQPEYLQVCKKYGYTHYRGFLENWLYKPIKTSSRYSLKGALRLLDTYFSISGSRTFDVANTSIIKNVPASMFLRPYSNKLSFLESFKVRRIINSMEYAARKGKCFHLWWHPHNFGQNTEENLSQLEAICKTYKRLHDKNNFKSVFIKEL